MARIDKMPDKKEHSEAHLLFEKLVQSERKLAIKCVKEKTNKEEMKMAVFRFLKTRSAKKILRNN